MGITLVLKTNWSRVTVSVITVQLLACNDCRTTEFSHKKFCLVWHCDPTPVMASSFLRFLDHTQRRSTVGRTPPDEWSARRRDLYLTTHNTQSVGLHRTSDQLVAETCTWQHTTQSVGLLWTSDQLVAGTSTWQHTTRTTDKHPCPRWDSNARSQQVSGYWDRLSQEISSFVITIHQQSTIFYI